MSYLFRTLSPAEFDAFAKTFSFASIMQTSSWGKVKSEWKSEYYGLFKDGSLSAAALILIRNMPFGLKLGYCPRGPLCDLSDGETVSEFTKGLLRFAKELGLYAVKIDPLLVRKAVLPDCEKDYTNTFEEDGERGAKNLTDCGFIHLGFPEKMSACIQPRLNAYVPLKDNLGHPFDKTTLKAHCRKSIRKYIGDFQTTRGIYLQESDDASSDTVLDEFVSVVRKTEERQGILLRDKSYFRRITQAFGDRARIFFARCDIDVYLEYLNKRAEKETYEAVASQISAATEIKKERGRDIPLAAILLILPPNDTGETVGEYLYAANDLTVFSSFGTAHSALFDMLTLCAERGLDYVNLGGIESFEDGLYTFKSKLNPIVAEFYGEFDLPISLLKYRFASRMIPLMTSVYKKLVRAVKKRK